MIMKIPLSQMDDHEEDDCPAVMTIIGMLVVIMIMMVTLLMMTMIIMIN